MKKVIKKSLLLQIILLLFIIVSCSSEQQTVKSVIDNIVTRFYETMDETELFALDNQKILSLISEKEKEILSTKYWTFDVNVPVILSIMHHVDQQAIHRPFWLTEENGFVKTGMIVKNEHYTYEVWQKSFGAGCVELGINGFDKHRPVYFVSIAAQKKEEKLQLSNFYPENQYISVMDVGAFTYHDWDELVLLEVPEELKGQKLLTTIRGRAREAHLIHAFRKTPFPSSPKPDQVMLTWSENPQFTQTIQWRTSIDVNDGVVVYAEKISETSQNFKEVKALCQILEDRLLQNDRYIHRFTAVLENLKPATTYVCRVGSHMKNKWSQDAEFITSPDSSAPFTFVYFGDTHKSPHWGKLINTAFERHPETAFYTIAGDLVSTGLYRDDWDQLFEYSADVIKHRALMPCLGNHDDQDGLGAWMYNELFALPQNGPFEKERESTYSFNYSNALFLILDVTSSYESQVDWIEEQLSTTNATWKFAVFHFPPYMYDSEYQDIRDLWGTVFDKYHLDMAFSGHVHYYARSKPIYDQKPVNSPAEGTIYVTSIAIPSGDEEQPEEKYTEVHFGGGMLYQLLKVENNRLEYRVYNLEGDIKDELVIVK